MERSEEKGEAPAFFLRAVDASTLSAHPGSEIKLAAFRLGEAAPDGSGLVPVPTRSEVSGDRLNESPTLKRVKSLRGCCTSIDFQADAQSWGWPQKQVPNHAPLTQACHMSEEIEAI